MTTRRGFLAGLLGTVTAAALPIPAKPVPVFFGIDPAVAEPDLTAWFLGPAIRARSAQMAYALQRVHRDQMAEWGLLHRDFSTVIIPRRFGSSTWPG